MKRSQPTRTFVSALQIVARIERSEIRVRSRSFHAAPGFRCTQPGLRRHKKKEMDRRQAHCGQVRTAERPVRKRRTGRAADMAACAALSASGALACRRSTTALAAATERHRSAPVHALPGGGTTERRALSVPCRSSAAGLTPQTGHSAGRAFWPRAAREPRLTRPLARGNRTRPLPPASPGGVLPGARFDSSQCIYIGD